MLGHIDQQCGHKLQYYDIKEREHIIQQKGATEYHDKSDFVLCHL
jgi:hypothetical protein